MKWIVTISAFPARSESIAVEAARSIDALRDVMGREMVVAALERKAEASLCISVMKERGKREAATTTPGSQSRATTGEPGGLVLR